MRLIILIVAMLWAVPAAAADNDAELWTTLGASGSAGGRLLINLEAIARFSQDEGGFYEGEIGGFLGLKLNKRVSAWAGYVHVPRIGANEDRTRQQITADLGRLLGGKLSGRLRLEQRFRAGGGTGWRLRPQLKFSRPLSPGGPALVASHESFIPLNDTGWGQRSRYERMRNFVGVSVPLVKSVSAEFGYLNQHNFRPGRDSVDHVGALTLGYSF